MKNTVLQCECEVFNWSLCSFCHQDEWESYVCLFLVHVMCVCAEAASLADSFSLYAHLSVCLFLFFVSPITPAGHLSHLFYLASSLHTRRYTHIHVCTHTNTHSGFPRGTSSSLSLSLCLLFCPVSFSLSSLFKKFPFKSTQAKMNKCYCQQGVQQGRTYVPFVCISACLHKCTVNVHLCAHSCTWAH